MALNNILIIAAHPDDEVLGAGGTILKHTANGDNVNILILGDGETARNNHTNIAQREIQAQKVSNALGAKNVILKKLPDNKFDSLPLLDIVKEVECVLFKLRPNIIYTHHPYDLNIDHQLTFKAALTACRPQPDFFVKKILSFEVLSSTEWQFKHKNYNFIPSIYNDISNFINQKVEILKIYKTELREYPHPRSIEGVKILAQCRGMEIGCNAAESFQLIRELYE